MKFLIFSLTVSISLTTMAKTIYLTGNGRFSQTCFGSDISCANSVRRMAEEQGRRDVLYTCQSQRGRLLNASCNAFCNPAYIPINQPQTIVSCSATCSGACEIEN